MINMSTTFELEGKYAEDEFYRSFLEHVLGSIRPLGPNVYDTLSRLLDHVHHDGNYANIDSGLSLKSYVTYWNEKRINEILESPNLGADEKSDIWRTIRGRIDLVNTLENAEKDFYAKNPKFAEIGWSFVKANTELTMKHVFRVIYTHRDQQGKVQERSQT